MDRTRTQDGAHIARRWPADGDSVIHGSTAAFTANTKIARLTWEAQGRDVT